MTEHNHEQIPKILVSRTGKEKQKTCVVVFVKAPEKGKVKSRISSLLGNDITLNIYRNFVADILDTLQRCADCEIIIAFSPINARKKILSWLGKRYVYLPQYGRGLGKKMTSAFQALFTQGYNQVVIIGSDIPDLPCSFIKEAFDLLSTHDSVIGPSYDGGYYLMGLKPDKFFHQIFQNMRWSTDKVFVDTVERLKNLGLTTGILPRWWDIDVLNDIKLLWDRSRGTPFWHSRTISCIKGLRYKKII